MDLGSVNPPLRLRQLRRRRLFFPLRWSYLLGTGCRRCRGKECSEMAASSRTSSCRLHLRIAVSGPCAGGGCTVDMLFPIARLTRRMMNRRDALYCVVSPGGAIGGPGRASDSRGYRRIWIMTRETHAFISKGNKFSGRGEQGW